MSEFTDQDLSAYIDGELPEARTIALRDALQTNPDLVDRLEALKTANQEFLTAHLDIADEPIPQSLLDVLEVAEPSLSRSADVVTLPNRLQRLQSWALPLAACFVLAIGVVLGAQLDMGRSQPQGATILAGLVAQNTPLYQALEQTPSQQSVNEITPVLTYAAEGGGYCREVEKTTTRALACRSLQGQWNVVAVVAVGASADPDTYIPAAAGTSQVLELLADRLMIDLPLSADDERELLAEKWEQTP